MRRNFITNSASHLTQSIDIITDHGEVLILLDEHILQEIKKFVWKSIQPADSELCWCTCRWHWASYRRGYPVRSAPFCWQEHAYDQHRSCSCSSYIQPACSWRTRGVNKQSEDHTARVLSMKDLLCLISTYGYEKDSRERETRYLIDVSKSRRIGLDLGLDFIKKLNQIVESSKFLRQI